MSNLTFAKIMFTSKLVPKWIRIFRYNHGLLIVERERLARTNFHILSPNASILVFAGVSPLPFPDASMPSYQTLLCKPVIPCVEITIPTGPCAELDEFHYYAQWLIRVIFRRLQTTITVDYEIPNPLWGSFIEKIWYFYWIFSCEKCLKQLYWLLNQLR